MKTKTLTPTPGKIVFFVLILSFAIFLIYIACPAQVYGQSSQKLSLFENYRMPGWGGSGKYNLTPYRQSDQDCREALYEYVDFKENPEKYHPNFIRTAYTHMVNSCMNSSSYACDPNYKMHPLVVEMLKENGCAQGKTDVEINKMISSDVGFCIP
jgi:hypothetical protein